MSQKELRDAYVAGLRAGLEHTVQVDDAVLNGIARTKYPPRMVTRPREVMFDRQTYPANSPRFYRVTSDGTLQVRTANTEWRDNNEPEWFAMLRDLFLNPTETVEDDR